MNSLSSAGFSNTDIGSISDDLSSLTSCFIDLDAIMNLIKGVMAKITQLIDSICNAWRALENLFISDSLFSSYEVLNAKTSISLPEPTLSATKESKIPDVAKADYTNKENYSRSYGTIDDAKNWYKVDKESKLTQMVHSSQSQFKIDKEGNTVINIKGNLKFLIEGDLGLEVKGNVDIKHGNYFEHTEGNYTSNITGKSDTTVAGDVLETYKGQQTTNVSGNVNYRGSTINLN